MRPLRVIILAASVMFAANIAASPETRGGLLSGELELGAFAKRVAGLLHLNLVIDPALNGKKVEFFSSSPLTPEETYQALLSALAMNDFTAIRRGGLIKIQRMVVAEVSGTNVTTGAKIAPDDALTTHVFKLHYALASDIARQLAVLLPSRGTVVYANTNALIITDRATVVRRLASIIEEVDQPTRFSTVEVLPLQSGDAKTYAALLGQMFPRPSGGSAGQKLPENALTGLILADEHQQAIIVFGNRAFRNKVRQALTDLVQQRDQAAGAARVEVIPLNFAQASKVAQDLQQLDLNAKSTASSAVQQNVGTPTKIFADVESNALVITASPERLHELRPVIAKLDQRRARLAVQVDVVEILTNDGFVFGTSSMVGSGGKTRVITGWQGGTVAPAIIGGSTTAGTTSTTTDAQAVAGAFSKNLTIGVLSGGGVNVPGFGQMTPGALVSLIKTDANSRILSSPFIFTNANSEASLAVGETIMFRNAHYAEDGTLTNTIDKEDATVELKLTGTVLDDKHITLQLELDLAQIGATSSAGPPNLTKRRAKQTLLLDDGQVAFVAGVRQVSSVSSTSRIPILGDIPFLGYLFNNLSRQKTANSVLIFVRPYCIRDEHDFAAIMATRHAELVQAKERLTATR